MKGLKKYLPNDIIERYFKPQLHYETRKTQMLVDDLCRGRGQTVCDLSSKGIKSVGGIDWPSGIRRLYLRYNEIAELSQNDVS